MPLLIIIAIALLTLGFYNSNQQATVGDRTMEQYVTQCQAKGGEAVRGFMPNGKDGVTCLKTKGLEIDLNQ